MTREIKFRGKDLNGNWHIGLLAVISDKVKRVTPGFYISNSEGIYNFIRENRHKRDMAITMIESFALRSKIQTL